MSTKIVTLISEEECIGDSLETLNANFEKLDSIVATISANIFGYANSTKTVHAGTGVLARFSVEDAVSLNANNYRVDIDGVLQEPGADYIIDPGPPIEIVFTSSPPAGTKIVIVTTTSVIV